MRSGNNPYGVWGKHLETFELFEHFQKNPSALKMYLQESDPRDAAILATLEEGLQEGSGAPEGRVDFPMWLQTIIRHRVRQRFAVTASRFREYTGQENAQDFRAHTVSSLGRLKGIRNVLEHEGYSRMRSSEEEGPSFAVGKYGGIYGVTFELVINDEKEEILNNIPRELGESMAEYQSRTVVSLIESNPDYMDGVPFFHSSRGNNITGSAATINESNIMAAIDVMSLRKDDDGYPINVTPEKVLVRKPSDAALFRRLKRSTTTGVTSDARDVAAPKFFEGNYNPVKDELASIPDAIVEPWLNAPNDWYMFANAQRRPAFVVAYLRNQTSPAIFQQDSGMRTPGGGSTTDPYSMDFDEIPFKVRHIFGAAPGEPLAAVRFQP